MCCVVCVCVCDDYNDTHFIIISYFTIITTTTTTTGGGKTTLLSQLSIDWALNNKPVLWGSFEVRNERLLHKMLVQCHRRGDIRGLERSGKCECVGVYVCMFVYVCVLVLGV